jgi:hypothetical protein
MRLRLQDGIAALLLLAGALALGYGPTQSGGWTIVGLYAFLFAVYAFILARSSEEAYPFFKWWSIALRFSLVAALPNLSDDVYRFIWDGRLILQGVNPFDHIPRFYMDPAHALPGLDEDLFLKLNSQDYHTVYPPLAQLGFALSVALFPKSILGAAIVLKILHALLDTGAVLLLEKLVRERGRPQKSVLIYALNPLIIVELTGNLHFECGMVFFLALALWWMSRGRWYRSAWAWAGAIGAKLLPLMFLPFLIRRLGWPRFFGWSALLGLSLLLLFLPLLNSLFLSNMGSSLDLYFRRFEFNASLYYLIRWLGFQWKGYNLIQTIGPVMALLVLLIILTLAWRDRGRGVSKLPEYWLAAITVYLLFSTTVHPWYLALPVFFSALTAWRFPLVWSALIPLSYLAYTTPEVHQPAWTLWVQYGAVALVMIRERYQLYASSY